MHCSRLVTWFNSLNHMSDKRRSIIILQLRKLRHKEFRMIFNHLILFPFKNAAAK